MAEMMLFPKTWEEFEKHYGFYDSKQAYMYGNTRLIPSFRVQQWLNHIDDINRKKQSQKNKMEQIAKMFGKELGEEFVVCTQEKERFTVSIHQDGVYTRDGKRTFWVLERLLTGEAEIVEE